MGERDRRLAASLNFAFQASGVVLLVWQRLGRSPARLRSVRPRRREFDRRLPPLSLRRSSSVVTSPQSLHWSPRSTRPCLRFAWVIFGAVRDLPAGYAAASFALAACMQLAAIPIVMKGGRRRRFGHIADRIRSDGSRWFGVWREDRDSCSKPNQRAISCVRRQGRRSTDRTRLAVLTDVPARRRQRCRRLWSGSSATAAARRHARALDARQRHLRRDPMTTNR